MVTLVGLAAVVCTADMALVPSTPAMAEIIPLAPIEPDARVIEAVLSKLPDQIRPLVIGHGEPVPGVDGPTAIDCVTFWPTLLVAVMVIVPDAVGVPVTV